MITFKSRFTKLARQIVPPPGDSVLSSRFIEAVTRRTGSIYDDRISSASAIGGQDDFIAFSTLITRLCTQKAARMTAQREASVGPTELNALLTRMKDLHESIREEREQRDQWEANYTTEGEGPSQQEKGGGQTEPPEGKWPDGAATWQQSA